VRASSTLLPNETTRGNVLRVRCNHHCDHLLKIKIKLGGITLADTARSLGMQQSNVSSGLNQNNINNNINHDLINCNLKQTIWHCNQTVWNKT